MFMFWRNVVILLAVSAVVFLLCGIRMAYGQDAVRAQANARVDLGHKLFFDPRMSRGDFTACASCHNPARGFSDGRPKAVGLIGSPESANGEGFVGERNTPTIYEVSHKKRQFLDGRADDLYDQCLMPTQNNIEMGMNSINELVIKIDGIRGYRPLFAAAFGSDQVTAPRMRKALVAFMATIHSTNCLADQLAAGNYVEAPEDVLAGWEIFKANCTECHKPEQDWRSDGYINIGVSLRSNPNNPDRGRAKIVQGGTLYGFQVPTLREIQLTHPYMHDGSMETLEEVVAFYDDGATWLRNKKRRTDPTRDKRVRDPLYLGAEGRAHLTAFLRVAFAGTSRVVKPPQLPR